MIPRKRKFVLNVEMKHSSGVKVVVKVVLQKVIPKFVKHELKKLLMQIKNNMRKTFNSINLFGV